MFNILTRFLAYEIDAFSRKKLIQLLQARSKYSLFSVILMRHLTFLLSFFMFKPYLKRRLIES